MDAALAGWANVQDLPAPGVLGREEQVAGPKDLIRLRDHDGKQ
jgi:hypothetical protein